MLEKLIFTSLEGNNTTEHPFFRQVNTLVNLESLSLHRWAITDNILQLLASLPRLSEIKRLCHSPSAYSDDGIVFLHACATRLTRLDLRVGTGNDVTARGVEQLVAAAIPNLRQMEIWEAMTSNEPSPLFLHLMQRGIKVSQPAEPIDHLPWNEGE